MPAAAPGAPRPLQRPTPPSELRSSGGGPTRREVFPTVGAAALAAVPPAAARAAPASADQPAAVARWRLADADLGARRGPPRDRDP
jgi:hypothetical protein